jgi:hypothetical protein
MRTCGNGNAGFWDGTAFSLPLGKLKMALLVFPLVSFPACLDMARGTAHFNNDGIIKKSLGQEAPLVFWWRLLFPPCALHLSQSPGFEFE